jgi:hypothetical protein
MIVCKLNGGLGNQLFQYAVGRQVSMKTGAPLLLDGRAYANDPLRNLQLPFLETKGFYVNGVTASIISVLQNAEILKIYKEKKVFEYDESITNIGWFTLIEGYWQNYNYFHSIKKTLQQEFTIKHVDERNKNMMKKIKSSENPVCLHIRRGDYVTNPQTNKVHGVIDQDYYIRNIKYLKETLSRFQLFVFSDDIDWAKENIKYTDTTFIDFNSGDEAYKDFALMRSCKHFIIPNSTLSWWAAWLEGEKGLVIAPSKWLISRNLDLYGNLVPREWRLV